LSSQIKFILLFIFLLVFRVFFGATQPFFHPDELQTYLIGLRTYTEGIWPYFGPDLILTETGFYSQIPGALEGLMAGIPFYLCPIPEAPFIMINLFSLAALALLARYIHQRLPDISFYFIFAWMALLPWNLHESAHPYNPSYLLFGSVFFFLGFLESLPGFSMQWLSPAKAFAFMGFGLFWNMQFHFSWVLFPPFLLGTFLWRLRKGEWRWAREVPGFVAGSAIPLAFLIPTLLKFGLSQGAGGMGLAVPFSWDNFKAFVTILARYYSLVSYELPMYLGAGTSDRVDFFKQTLWVAPPGLLLVLVGWAQAIVLAFWGFWSDKRHPEVRILQIVTWAGFLLVWVEFWFTTKLPQPRMYYIMFPLIAVYSFYLWSRIAQFPYWRTFGKVCLVASLWFELGYLIHMIPIQSMYTNRPLVVKAIQEKDYHLLGERRPGSRN